MFLSQSKNSEIHECFNAPFIFMQEVFSESGLVLWFDFSDKSRINEAAHLPSLWLKAMLKCGGFLFFREGRLLLREKV
ncbi:MAG: hypothetical protein ACFUZC_16290 [Chthoniobacteraceae bacterium]